MQTPKLFEPAWVQEQVTDILFAYGMGGFDRIKGEAVILRTDDTVYGVGALARASSADGWLNCIAIRKGFHRRGYGALIVEYLLATASEHVWLETMFWNRRFYESLGFAHVPIDKAIDVFGLDPRTNRRCMMMWRHCAPAAS